MNISDLDIYNDLDGFQEQEEKKSAELLALETKYKESLETIEQMKLELKTLRKQQSTIKVNFQNLLDTAKREIKRKDLQILQLRKEKDDICFRRRNPTNWFGYQEHQHPRDADYLQQEQLNQQWEVETQHRYENPFKKKPIHTITAAQLSAKTSDDAVQTVAEVTKRQRSPVLKEDGGTPEIDKHNDKKLRFVDEQQQSAAGVTTTNRLISPVKDSGPPKIDKHYDNKLRHCGPQQHKAHSSAFTYSCSGDDNKDVASSNQTISSHSRERHNNRYNIAPRNRSRSRYNGYKNKYSDEEERGSVYQRERSRGRRERLDAGDYEAHHHRRRSRSRERGRQRERHGSSGDDHEQRKRRASRGKELQLNREHHKYSKAVSDEDLRKESSHTEGSRGSSKESYKKYEHKMIERHEAKHERKSRRHSEKEALEKERTLHKSQEITFKENYKSKKCTEEGEIKVDEDQKITPKEKKLTYQEKLKKLKSMETSVTNVNFCSSSEERKCLNVDENKHTKNIEAATKVDVAQKSTNTLKPMAKAFVLPYPEEELNSSEVKLTASSSTKTISTINKQPKVDPQAETEQQSKNLKAENENVNITRKDIPKNIENIKNFDVSKSIESLGSKATNHISMATNIVSQNSNQEFGESCNHSQMESALNTPKKVALFNEIFGPSPGAQQQASSKLLTNVLQILNSSSASTSPSNFSDISELDPKYIEKQKQPPADTQIKPKDVEEYFCELKKTVAETKETESNFKNVFEKEIEELIPGLAEVEAEIEEIVSEQNEALKDEMQKNLTHLKYNDVIEIEDDSDGTDEDIVFSKVESVAKLKYDNRQSAPAINAKKLCSAESTKEVEGRTGEIISKTSKNVKKPIIEIIEDIRLPTMLPIKQILKVEAENAAIETRHSENVDDITQQKKEREDENIKNDTHKACDNNNASDKTSRKKTEKHNSDEKVKTPEILTTISIDDDDRLTNEDHKKENDFQTLNILEKIDNNTTELEKYTPDKQKITAAVPGFQQKIATNISSNVLPLCKESVFKGKSTIFNNNQIRASLKGFVIPKKKAKGALDINVVQQKNLKNSTKNTDMEIMSETHNKEKIKDRNETKTNIDFKDSKNITNQKNITAIDNEAITSKDIAVDENNQQIDIIGKFETTDISKNTQKTSNNKLITAKSQKEIDPVIESVHICHKNITTAMTKKEEQRNDDILKNNMADSKDQKSLQTFSDNNKKSGTEKDDAKTEVISDKQENANAVAKIVKEVMNKNTAIVVATINHNTQSNIQQKLVADTGINSTSSEQLKNSKVFVENVTVDYPKDPRTSSQKIHTKPNQQEKIENKLDIIGYINKSMSALIEKNQRTEDKVFTGTDSIIDSTADLRNSVDNNHTKIDLPKVFESSTKTGIALSIEDIDEANIEAKGDDENSKGTESDEKKAKDKNRKNSTQNEPEEFVNYKTGRLSAKLKNKRDEDENIFTPFENIQNNRNVEDSRKMVDVKEAKNSTEKPASCKVDSGIRKPFEDQHIHDNSEDTVTFIECAKTRTKNFDNEDGEKRCNENISSKDENRKIMEHDKIISETFVSTDIPSAKTQITEQAALQKDEGAKPEKKCNIPDIENYSQIAVPDDLIVKKTVDGIVKSAGTDNSDSYTGARKTKIMHVATTAHTGAKKLFSYKLAIDDNLEHIKNVTKTEDRQSLDFENKSETKDAVKNDKNVITINHKADTQFTFNPKKVVIKDAENIDSSDEETFDKKSAVTDYDHSNGKSEKENVKDVVNDENKQITLPEPASELAAEKEVKTCKHDKDTNITNELKKEMPQKPASDNEKIKVICNEKVQEDDTQMSSKKVTNSKHPDIEPHKERFSTTALNVQNKADAKLRSIDNPKSSKAKFAPNSLTNAVSSDNLSQELAIRQLNELVPENKMLNEAKLNSQKSKHTHEVDEKEGEEEIRYSEDKNYSNTTFKERNDFLQQRPTLEKLKHAKLVKDVPAEEKISNKKASPMKLKTFFKIALPSPIKERKRKHSVEKKVGLLAAKQAEYSAGVSEKSFESRTPAERKRFEENDEKPLVKRLKPNEKPTLPIKAQSVETSSVEDTLHSIPETSKTLHVKQENLGTASKEESPVTSRKTATTPNQAKPTRAKNFRRILDSSDEDIPIAIKTNLSNIAVKTQASKAHFLSPKLELKRKRTKTRKLHVISVETAANTVVPAADSVLPVSNKLLTTTDFEVQTANSAQPAKNLPLPPVMPIFVRAPPTPDHAIFHSEPSGLSPEASLPQFNILQDKQYSDIDSRLQTMFQSPPYVATEATISTLTAVTNKSVSTTPESAMNCNQFDMTIDETLGISAQADQSTILDDSSKNSSFETKRLSLGNSEYRVEKVSENVVNVFITRKRHKKKSDKIAVATEPLPVGGAALV